MSATSLSFLTEWRKIEPKTPLLDATSVENGPIQLDTAGNVPKSSEWRTKKAKNETIITLSAQVQFSSYWCYSTASCYIALSSTSSLSLVLVLIKDL